jgi:serine/threonine-protein kinase
MDDLTGRTLGPYDLGDRIGTGGMALVYRGVHRALGMTRAVKVLLPTHATDPTLVERFRAEGKLASGLRHPNIVSIYDVGEENGLYYLVMDLVEGVSLRNLLEHERGLPLDRAVGMLRQLGSALDYAHGRGIIHRDIKAGNVLVGPDDQVTLFDFGIARGLDLSRLTKPGLMVGTPHYLAPEVISGEEGDRRADLYSLGVLAYEMLAGQLPFVGNDTMAVLYAQVNRDVPAMRGARPDLPESVEAVVRRQLAKRPDARYTTADAFVSALAEAAQAAAPANGASAEPDLEAPETIVGGVRPVNGRAGSGVAAVDLAVGATADGVDDTITPPSLEQEHADDEMPTPRPFPRPTLPIVRLADETSDQPTLYPMARPAHLAAGDSAVADGLRKALQASSGERAVAPRRARRRPVWLVLIGVLVLGLIAVGVMTLRQPGVIGTGPTPATSAPTQAPVAATAQATLPPTAVAVAQTLDAPPTAVPTATSAPAATVPPPTLPPAPTATAVVAGVAAPPSPEQQLGTALAAIDGGDFPTALAMLAALQEGAPTTDGLDDALYRAHVGYGRQLLDQGSPDESYAEYGEALKLRPDDPAAQDGQKQAVLLKLWSTMEAAWDQDEAVATAALEEILALDPGYRDASVKLYALLVSRADRLLEAGDQDGAIVALRRAREVYPDGEEAPARLEALTAPPPEPTPAPAVPAQPAQAPAPAPAAKPAPAPASAPAPAQKPISPPIQPPAGLPSLPNPGGLPGLPLP